MLEIPAPPAPARASAPPASRALRSAAGHGGGYRPDIDGLRAVAVLSVVLYHLAKRLLPGGYVGVDIFFVISGFLITRNIWGEMQEGRFSFGNFYLRRIRRIAPAFLAMAAVTLLAGVVLLLPDDMVRLARSALWGAFSASNVYFWRYLDTGYFAASSDEEPLLHTWSLGVEEQFYFLWPTLLLLGLLLARRRRGGAIGIAAIACVLSFWCGEATHAVAQKFAYYMLPARGGELMVGALLALWRDPRVSRQDSARAWWIAEALALAGLALIAWSLLRLNDDSAFPGINALWPCLGAALVMLAGELRSRTVGVLLAAPPMVYIGLISYSLYLWHWPVLAFLRYFHGGIDLAQGMLAVALMFPLAIASYRLVERPLRQWRPRPRVQVLALYAVPTLLLCVAALVIVRTDGLKRVIESSRVYRDGMARVEQYTAPAYKFPYNCQLSAFDPEVLRQARCIVPARAGALAEPGLLLWGDSEAAHYIGVLGQLARNGNFAFRNATHSSCPPVFDGDYGVAPYKAGCDRFRPYMREAILGGAFRTVVISGAWAIYDGHPGFRADLERTLAAMTAKGVRVVVIGQAPYFANYNRECELRGLRLGGVDCRNRLAVPDAGDSAINAYLAALPARFPGVSYLDLRALICHDGKCDPYIDGRPVYFDGSHLSMDGSWLLGTKLLASADRARWTAAINASAAAPVGSGALRSIASMPAPASTATFTPRTLPLILGGYRPSFPYHVRSQAHLELPQGPAGVVLEFWGRSQQEIAEAMRRDLGGVGFRLAVETHSSDGIRMDFTKAGFPKVSVSIGAGSTLQLQAPGAAGIVYLRW